MIKPKRPVMKNETLTLKYDKGKFPVYYAEQEHTNSGIILIEEIWGLNDHIKDVANRLAAIGYSILAPELLSDSGVLERISPDIFREMADPAKRDEAQKRMRDAIAPVYSPDFGKNAIGKLQSSFDFLKKKGIENIAVMGFCFGGTYSFAFATENKHLKACAAFYGQPPLGKTASIHCPVLAFYGEKDTRLMESLPVLQEQMEKHDKEFNHKVYNNTGHAFFNDTNPMTYNQEAAEDAWIITVEFLRKYLS